ncbi:MAG: hypothetical protein CHH17_12140 [Candidatus Fluviicola riflensis]|nr:MAG: hypothetical protein CHH17_12140 [Candidatus Fluviicola riflensis]
MFFETGIHTKLLTNAGKMMFSTQISKLTNTTSGTATMEPLNAKIAAVSRMSNLPDHNDGTNDVSRKISQT